MARYGFGIYDRFKYGEKDNSAIYYNSGITAFAYDYAKIQITWGRVTPDPGDPTPVNWMLVKTYTGTPDNPFDGIKLAGDVYANYTTTYYDDVTAALGLEVTYSFWIFNGNGWVFCGSSTTVGVPNKDMLAQVLRWLPRAWENSSQGIGDATGEPGTGDFVNTMSGLTFAYDKLRTQASILANSANHIYAPNEILKYKVTDFGFNYEPSLGDPYHRTLYNAGNVINGLKGTSQAIKAYTTALTHLDADVTVGNNLMLDYNDSSFEETVGRWVASSGTFTQLAYANSSSVFGSTITPPTPGMYDFIYPPRQVGFAYLTTTGTTPVTLTLPGNGYTPILNGIPVQPNTRYVFTGWVQHANASATVTAQIKWYDQVGNYISTTTAGATTTTTTSWQEFISACDSGRNGKLSPYNAQYAVVLLTITPSSGTNKYLFDMFQFADPISSFEYEDARRVRVYIGGERENYIDNPGFEQGIGGWTVSPNASFAEDPTIYPGAVQDGATVGEITVETAGTAYVTSDWMYVDPNQSYTFSAYVSAEFGISRQVYPRIEYSNPINFSTATDSNGIYFPANTNYTDGTPTTTTFHYVYDSNGNPITDPLIPGNPPQQIPNKSRISVTAISPSYDKDYGYPMAKVSIWIPNAQVGDTIWIDGVLLEDATSPRDYFSGTNPPAPIDPLVNVYFNPIDCIWEYKNKINFLSNPSFETTSDWTINSGSTLSLVTSGTALYRVVNSDGSYGGIGGTVTYYPLAGTYMGRITYSTAALATGGFSTTVYLPEPAIGGEDIVSSIYVRAAEGVYTISSKTSGGTVISSNQIYVVQHDQYQWIRLHNVHQAAVGETSFVFSITVQNFSAPSTGMPQSGYFDVDAAQVEYGRIPNGFTDPQGAYTVARPNPGNPSKNMYLSQYQSVGGGKSSYFHNYYTKLSRLKNSLALVMPSQATWAVKPGMPSRPYAGELVESLIPSASFEKDLGQWTAVTSTLTRVYANGILWGDSTVHGVAYCQVTTAGSSGSSTFGIQTGNINVSSELGYYSSVAIRPANAASVGSYTLTVTYYTLNGTQVSTQSQTTSITQTNRWAYMSVISPAANTIGASYAILKVTCTPTAAYSSTQAFHIDKAVFRQ